MKKIDSSINKLITAIALTAQYRKKITKIPTEVEWQQFLKHKTQVNESLLESIDSDPEKFEQWIKSAKNKNKVEQKFWDLSVFWESWGMPMAMAAVLVLSVLVVTQYDFKQDKLQQSYQQVALLLSAAPSEDRDVKPLTFIEENAFGFSAQSKTQNPIASFLNGINLGRAELFQQVQAYNPPSFSINTDWQRFGQWYILNQTISESTLTPDADYWQQQQTILQQLKSKLQQAPSLAPLENRLKALQQQPLSVRNKQKFKQQLLNYWLALQVSYAK